MNLELMNELVKKDLSDIVQVNVPSWLTVGWIKGWLPFEFDLEVWNAAVQSYGPSFIILITIGFTLFKFFRVIQHYRWEKKDRREEVAR